MDAPISLAGIPASIECVKETPQTEAERAKGATGLGRFPSTDCNLALRGDPRKCG